MGLLDESSKCHIYLLHGASENKILHFPQILEVACNAPLLTFDLIVDHVSHHPVRSLTEITYLQVLVAFLKH